MRFFNEKQSTFIVLEALEEERAVLRAIVKASFELALPVGLSVIDYNPHSSLSDVDADRFIRSVPRSCDGSVIDMDFVQGRQCKTAILKETPGRFRLDSKYFERYRGSCAPVLQRAQELIRHSGSITSESRFVSRGGAKALAAAK